MPSLSPGSESPSSFAQVLPGAPAEALQALTTFIFRWKRYIVYISGKQLNILRSPTELVQAITFDEELVAVGAEGEESAKIAVASSAKVWVLESTTNDWNLVTWRKALLLKREDAGDKTRSLSWGIDGELLVGGSKLVSLFSVLPSSRESSPVRTSADKGHLEERHVLWSKSVPSALQAAVFSPSASLIASFGPRDRLVKIWRRLSFEEGLFDYTYLPHPGPVTHIEWRRPDAPKLEEEADESDDARAKSYGTRHEEDQELLYTFCADGLLRVWKTGGLHELEVMVLHTTIDLVGAIPHSPSLSSTGATAPKPTRYAFVLSSGTLSNAIGAAISKQHVGKLTHSLEHLKEISSKHPDAVVTLDGLGRMSAWGLQAIGHRRRPSTPSGNSKQAFHITHAEDLDMKLPVGSNARFESWFDGDQLNVVAHSFDGSVSWWQGGVEQFLSPATKGSDRLVCSANWSGNKDAVAGLRSHTAKEGLLAWASNGGLTHLVTAPKSPLRLAAYSIAKKKGSQTSQIIDAYSLDDQNNTLCADSSVVSVIGPSGAFLASAAHSQDQSLRLLRIRANDSSSHQSFILLDRSGSYAIVTVSNLSNESQVQVAVGKRQELPIMGDLSNSSSTWKDMHVVPHPRRPSWLRLIAISEEGAIWRRDVPSRALLEDASKATEAPLSFLSGLTEPSLLDATCDVAALASADGSSIVVLDLKGGYVEHRQELKHAARCARLNVCRRSSSDHVGDANTTLAIAYSDSVDILAQARYEQASSAEQHTWHHLKNISIAGIGLRISAIAWLPRDELLIAAGQSLFRSDGLVAGTGVVPELRDRLDMKPTSAVRSDSLMHALRLPLVSWHPHFLHQLVMRGQLHSATGILRRLERSLRFYTEGDDLNPLLDAKPQDISAGKAHADNALLDSDTINSLQQQLEEIDLPKTSNTEQERLKIVLGTIIYMQDHIGSLDENGLRYLFSWKLHVLELEGKRDSSSGNDDKSTSNGDDAPPPCVPKMSWREIVFAYHSESQQPLLEALHNYYGVNLDWPAVRQLGIPAWLHAVRAAQSEGSDLASLEQIFETLAQKAFRSTYPPDPTRASLFFLALKKKATLLALWRVAVGNKEQRSTMNFLKRDFTLEENRTAARKNAYALMGKRRFEYAAAFFLLANDPASAIRILAGQCQDLPLAIAVARVYCDDGSPELMKFIEERVLPSARQAGDRWLLSWVHEMMGHSHLAAQALVIPVDKFEVKDAERLPRHWQQDDPLTLKLYQHFRDRPVKPGQNKKSRSLGGEQHEYRAILRAARILRKMGLWLLALELVSTWRFATPPPPLDDNNDNGDSVVASNGVHEQSDNTTPSVLDGFSAPSSSTTQESMPEDSSASKPAPAPKSLLDDFDSLSLQPSPADKAKSDRGAKAAELMAKLKAKKEAASGKPAAGTEDEKKKKAPTQFKEPEASSILDSFGF
jgi:hypothetical protein